MGKRIRWYITDETHQVRVERLNVTLKVELFIETNYETSWWSSRIDDALIVDPESSKSKMKEAINDYLEYVTYAQLREDIARGR